MHFMIEEGKFKKGGVNRVPAPMPRPEPPKGQLRGFPEIKVYYTPENKNTIPARPSLTCPAPILPAFGHSGSLYFYWMEIHDRTKAKLERVLDDRAGEEGQIEIMIGGDSHKIIIPVKKDNTRKEIIQIFEDVFSFMLEKVLK